MTEYICHERIDRAKSFMLTTDMSLGRIAELSGFPDYYAFSHAFSRVSGMSASQYKRIKKQGDKR